MSSATQNEPGMSSEQPTASAGSRLSVDDLAMLIKQLVRHLKKANPSDELPEKAMDYLRRHNLQGSPFRGQNESS